MARYDRAITVFSPDGQLLQVQYAQEAIQKCSPVVGVRGPNVIVLAVEKRLVEKLQDERMEKKIVEIDEHVALAFAGLKADARVMISRVQIECQSHRLMFADIPSIEYISRYIAELKQTYTKSNGRRPFGLTCLVAGFDVDGTPHLFQTKPSGAYFEWKATSDDYVCEACWELSLAAVNQNLQENTGNEQQAGTSQRRGHVKVCVLCGCSLLKKQSDKILRDNPTDLQQNMIDIIKRRREPLQVTSSDKVCHVCWLRVKREALTNIQVDEARISNDAIQHQSVNSPQINQSSESIEVDQVSIVEENYILEDNQPAEEPHSENISRPLEAQSTSSGSLLLPDYRRAANTGNHCLFPDCTNVGTLHSVSDRLRAIILSNHKYYVPKRARVCGVHLFRNSWDVLYESDNSINVFNVEHVQHIFTFVNAFNPSLDFENIDEMDNRIFEYWVGLSKENFNIILEEVPRILQIKRGKLGLVSLLLKLRTAESDERIATLMQKPRRSLEVLMDQVREVLEQDFIPNHLGINHISREQLLNHNLIIPNGLYGNSNNAIVICDGTYIYINKSSNYMFQKDSYSLHKFRNLLKPFLIVASDGYIVDCLGPYKATATDAEIMSSLFRNESSALRSYFRENDVFILDRGFRDCINLLEECGYRAYMPDSLLEGEHQLTTAQANRSRCVTICRWVVEVVNGQLKRDYKILRQEYSHRSLPHMMQNVQIAAALLNKFGTRLKDNEYANEILRVINERFNFENNLAFMVDSENMNRRSAHFRSITADRNNLFVFPRLEYKDLILFALGTYQIRQARSYYGEHIRFHGGYRIEVCSELFNHHTSRYGLRGNGDITLIRGKIKSRHISRKQYYIYILIENNNPSRQGIVEYCCSCLVGRRTVGCCAHVMTVVWYLGWARHESHISAPADFLDEVVVRDFENLE